MYDFFRNRLFHKLFRCFLEANLQKTKSKTPELLLKKVLKTEVWGLRKQTWRLIQTLQTENLWEKRANLSHSWNIKFWTCPVVRNDHHLWSHVGYCLGSEVAAMALPGPLTFPLNRWVLWNKLIGDICLRNQNILGCYPKKIYSKHRGLYILIFLWLRYYWNWDYIAKVIKHLFVLPKKNT